MISNIINKYCNGDITKIENYENAVNDESQTWDCHHRFETHFSDGTERPVNARLSQNELKALGMYYHRPPEELIFLSSRDHMKLHNKGKKCSKETKKKLSEINKGHLVSEETRKKISEAKKGHKASEETKMKLSEAHKDHTSWNKGKHHSEEAKKKISEAMKGNLWNKGRKASEETKKKLSEALKGKNKGKCLSEETKKKLSEAIKGKHWKIINGKRVWY